MPQLPDLDTERDPFAPRNMAEAIDIIDALRREIGPRRSDARRIRIILWPTFVRHPEPPDTGEGLAPAVKWLRDAWRHDADEILRLRADLKLLRDAVVPVVEAARQVSNTSVFAVDAGTVLRRLTDAVEELDGAGSGARIAVGASEPVSVSPDEGLPVSEDLRVAYRAPGQFRRDAGTTFVCRRQPEIGELIVHPCPDCGHLIALHVATAECPVCRLVELTTPSGRRREAREQGVFIP